MKCEAQSSRMTTANAVVEQSFYSPSDLTPLYGMRSVQLNSIAEVESVQHGLRSFVRPYNTA